MSIASLLHICFSSLLSPSVRATRISMPKSFRSIPPLTEDLYGGLTPTEAARLVDAGVRAFAEGNHDMAEGIARWLVCLTVCWCAASFFLSRSVDTQHVSGYKMLQRVPCEVKGLIRR